MKKKCTAKEHIKQIENNKDIFGFDLPDRTLVYCSICEGLLMEFD